MNILKRPGSDFLRNVLALFSGTALANLIILLVTPLVSRLYPPDYFATLEIFTRITSVAVIFTTLRYEQALPMVQSQSDRQYILQFLIRTILITGGIVIIGLVVTYFIIHFNPIYWLLPISVVSLGLMNVFTFLSISEDQYAEYSKAKVFSAFSSSLTRVGLGYSPYLGMGLIVSYIINILFVPVYLLKRLKDFFKLKNIIKLSKRSHYFARRYNNFPKYAMWQNLLDVNRDFILVLCLQFYYNDTALGWYALMIRVLKVPVIFIGQSVRQVFFKQFSDLIAQKKTAIKLVSKITGVNFLIAIIPFTVLFFYGESLFIYIFGDEWAGAGRLASISAPWIFINFLTSSISLLPVSLEKQKPYLFWGGTGSIVLIASFFLGIYWNMSIENTFVLISAGQVIFLLALLKWYFSLVLGYEQSINSN